MRATQKSTTRYRIQINNQSEIPHLAANYTKITAPKQFCISFRNSPRLHHKINMLTSLRCGNLAQIKCITESYKTQQYTVTYENSCLTAQDNMQEICRNMNRNEIGDQIDRLMELLVSMGIRPQICVQNFGFTKNYNLKFYLFPNFQEIPTNDYQTAQQVIKTCCSKSRSILNIMPTTESSQKGEKTLNSVADEVKKLKNQMFQLNLKSREHNRQPSIKNGSDRSMPVYRTTSQNNKMQNIFAPKQKSFEDSYSHRVTNKKGKQTETIHLNKKLHSEPNISKGSYSEKSHSNSPENEKISILKERVSKALEKTQQTLTKYDKIRCKK